MINKRVFTCLATILLIPAMVFAQTSDCKKFRNGTFKMVYPGLGTAKIIRTWNVQREIITEKNIDFIFNIKWISDCSYTLMPTLETLKKYPSIPKNAVATVQIIKTTKNSYTQVTTTNYTKDKTTGEVIKTD